jgi:pimeloyl-ACP methyl ester carboxylesterase
MSDFVLVHGGWHGGWCWDRVRDRLAGHRVHAPTLKGLAERADELTDDLDLEVHVNEVVELIRSNELDEITLCGHSYGGAVITWVADLIPDAIRSIVYMDAYLPRSGESVISLTDGWVETDSPTLPVLPAAAFGITGDDAKLVDDRLTPHPAAASLQRLVLTTDQPADRIGHRTYVLATEWVGRRHFRETYERLKGDPAWITEAIAGSHDLMLDRPDDVARILLQSAGAAPGDRLGAGKGQNHE